MRWLSLLREMAGLAKGVRVGESGRVAGDSAVLARTLPNSKWQQFPLL